nr:tripartite motif-containing protein 5-like [Procambarus clarkii]
MADNHWGPQPSIPYPHHGLFEGQDNHEFMISASTIDNKPEECSVCFNDYDDNQLRPRNLPCGHTFCSQCIDNAIKNGQLSCPSCRAQHTATAATQFPISYAVEALVRKLKNIQLTNEEVVPAKPYEGPSRGINLGYQNHWHVHLQAICLLKNMAD